MQQRATRPWATTAIALAGAGMIAAAPLVAPPTSVQIPDISVQNISVQLMSAGDVVIDFIRHGESLDNVANLVGTNAVGASLTEEGIKQAEKLVGNLDVDGIKNSGDIFASEFLRAQQTAWPLLHSILGDSGAGSEMPTELAKVGDAVMGLPQDNVLAGLNEINAGILDKGSFLGSLMQPLGRLNEILYILPPFLWTLGFPIVPEWGSMTNFNGVVFNDNFTDAVDYIAGQVGPDGNAAAFSHAAAIMAWTQMNVNNPNPLMMFTDPLSNTDQVVVSGSPGDWTLDMWNGDHVGAANLWQDLFVNTRDLMVAPQAALTHVIEAALGQGPYAGDLFSALEGGLTDIAKTTLGYPGAMISDIVDAFKAPSLEEFGLDAIGGLFSGGGGLGDLSGMFTDLLPSGLGDILPTDLAGFLPAAADGLMGLLPGQLAELIASLLAGMAF
ncbi:hypothetical protein BHQ15_08625 [Mycolicibacillus koreensis]|nr:hypothetical protein BHQ15_08625 [Mycolicibacillus koreensis]